MKKAYVIFMVALGDELRGARVGMDHGQGRTR